MNKKNLMPQANTSTNSLIIQELSVELIELSEKDLQQIWGSGILDSSLNNLSVLNATNLLNVAVQANVQSNNSN